MKRMLTLMLAIVLCLGAVMTARADQPKPINVIPYDELPENLDGQQHILLLCVDQWYAKKGNLGNTDGIVLVTLDTRAHRVMLTSVIRDALVVRPDGVIGRVNYIAKNYGPEELCKVLSQHLGIRIDKYILFDFNQIQTIIEFMGGVDITITAAEASYLQRYAISKTSTTPAVTGPGTYRFGGHAAVIYMRIRKAGGGGDFMRTQRVRTVLSTLADQCRNITYDQAVALVDNVMANTTLTNMNLDEMLAVMDAAYSLRDCTVEELRIPQEDAVAPISYAGMSVQEVDWDMSREDMADYLTSSFLVLDED